MVVPKSLINMDDVSLMECMPSKFLNLIAAEPDDISRADYD
jgi:hypothetical protein